LGPNLNLQQIDLSGTDISNTRLSNANLKLSILSNTDLSGCDLSGTDLSGASVLNTKTWPVLNKPLNLPNNSYKQVNNKILGPNLNLQQIDLSGTDISNTRLSNANLKSSILSNTDLSGCDLSGTDLSGASVLNTKTWPVLNKPLNLPNNNYKQFSNKILGPNLNLQQIDLSGTDISNTIFSSSNLSFANLSSANLSSCNFSSSNLTSANLSLANFSFADLSGTDISNINLIGTNLTKIYNNPINIDSNWIFEPTTRSIVPVVTSDNTIKQILYNQISQSGPSSKIIAYKNADTFINQSVNLIKPQTDGSINWSNQANDIQVKINDISRSDVSNILINITKFSESLVTLPTINRIQPLFTLYFKALDSSANSIITPINPIIIEIDISTNVNFVILYKYINTSFNSNNYIIGTKLTSNQTPNTYKFIFTSNSEYLAIPTNSLSILSGGDPHIRPLLGPQYILPNDIKYVCLLDDQFIGLKINARVAMMKKSDFPNIIFARDQWCDSRKLEYLYNYSYYKELYISIGSDYILIDTDTLEIKSYSFDSDLKSNQKIKYLKTNSKKGIYSLIHGLEYPLFDTTKIIKIFVDKYIITFMSDITTDERHFINLEYYGINNITACNGAFISQSKTFVLDDIIGSNSDYYYKDFKLYLENLKQQISTN
jgi:uncharacterized protein YjbI with pentapeptide repeats